MAHVGVKTRFKLDNASGTLTDISTYLDSVQGSSDTEFLDGTTFQPDVVGSALRNEIPGFATKGLSLSGKWTEAAETFFSAIEGRQNLEYEYKPDDPNVNSSITGTCSCGSYSGPQSSVDGIITFTAELRVQSRSWNVGSAGSPE
jgi:hypothetical protein